MQEKMHFLCKCLIISTLNFWLFLDIFGQIGHFGVFWAKRASYVRELKYIRNARTRAKQRKKNSYKFDFSAQILVYFKYL